MVTINYYDSSHVLQTLNVVEDDNSYRYRALMTKPQMVLKFALPEYVEIPIGAYVTYQGETFILTSAPNIKKQGTRNIEYTLNMGTYQDNMSLYKMRNTVDGRLKYSMCSTPTEFITEIVANLNARDGANVWSVGDCIDTAPKTIEFNHTYIDAALSQVAEEFETEWEIVNHAIHLHPVKYNENAPLALSYGKGNGFVPGVGRTTPVGEQPIKRLYVQGGNRNIDRSTYGHSDLMLPYDQTLSFDGDKFEDETGYDSTKARTYKSDKEGYYIERYDMQTDSSKEDSIDCSDRYPSRVGVISSVVVVDASRNFYDVVDNSIPNDLNYESCLIEGETMTIIFQTGMLAGKEFDVRYHHQDRRFEIVPFEYDGITMPNATWIPQVGDTYAIFGCMLPMAYVCDNTSKEGASWEMFRMAVRYLYANEDQKFTFSGKLQAMWSRANWSTISPKLVVGGYIHFSDTQFAPSGTDIRIIGIKDYLTDPYAPTIDISNGIVGQSVTTTLVQVGCNEVTIGEAHTDSINFTKRRFRDTMDTMIMLQESLLEFSEGINPITVHAMQLLIGDEGLQFVFTDGNDVEWDAESVIIMNNTTKRLSVVNPSTSNPQSELVLKHTSIMHAIHSTIPPTYSKWIMTPFTSQVLSNQNQGYYLYAKCSSAEGVDTGEFLLSATAIGMESVTGYYHFLVGILGKEYDGERSFVSMYGFTEILPGRITTDRIVSADGQTYFDLTGGGYIKAMKALIWGSIRSPFVDSSTSQGMVNDYDNIYFSNSIGYVQLDWDEKQSGRKICVAGKGMVMRPPTGKYIYCDGLAISNPFIFENEILTMVGYGDDEDFFGWIITDRKQINATGSTLGFYGSGLKCIAMGTFDRVSQDRYVFAGVSFDGSNITVERQSVGNFCVNIPGRWFGSMQALLDAYLFVLATPTTEHTHVAVTNKYYNDKDDTCSVYFVVSQEGQRVDGYFNFAFFNMAQCIRIMP